MTPEERKELLMQLSDLLTNAGAQMRDLANEEGLDELTDQQVGSRAELIIAEMETSIDEIAAERKD